MKKMRKIFAMLLALAMVLGMATTVFAAKGDTSGSITINGLVSEGATDINVYQAVSLDANANNWVVADWAKDYIKLDGGAYVLGTEEELNTLREGIINGTIDPGAPVASAEKVNETTKSFDGLTAGAYVIIAQSAKATYTVMVADTSSYGSDGLITAKQATPITAKTSGYTTDKKADAGDTFVARGEQVAFTITTTFPSFTVANSKDNSFKIVDTPTGLLINGITEIKIGADDVTNTIKAIDGAITTDNENGSTKTSTIDLTSQIGTENGNAGKTVTVKYTATVTADNGYTNTANSWRNDQKLGDDSVVTGFTGDITVTKIDGKENTKLAGAQFTVTKDGAALQFVEVSDGVYKLAMEADKTTEGVTILNTVTTATNGEVKIQGLGNGTYHFEETVAPEGYAVVGNENGAVMSDVTINVENATEHVHVTPMKDGNVDPYENTKLSSLPSTGGIGTTIFTIGGCIIMIVAAGLFFATRRKAVK